MFLFFIMSTAGLEYHQQRTPQHSTGSEIPRLSALGSEFTSPLFTCSSAVQFFFSSAVELFCSSVVNIFSSSALQLFGSSGMHFSFSFAVQLLHLYKATGFTLV